MSDLFKVTLGEQIQEVERELAQRKHCYPRFVKNGQITQKLADRRTRTMQAVLETLQQKRAAELRLAPDAAR